MNINWILDRYKANYPNELEKILLVKINYTQAETCDYQKLKLHFGLLHFLAITFLLHSKIILDCNNHIVAIIMQAKSCDYKIIFFVFQRTPFLVNKTYLIFINFQQKIFVELVR